MDELEDVLNELNFENMNDAECCLSMGDSDSAFGALFDQDKSGNDGLADNQNNDENYNAVQPPVQKVSNYTKL